MSGWFRSKTYVTPLGPVDAAVGGAGPAVMIFHGAPGGSDQGRLLGELTHQGFRVIALSRPGYLDTPLSSGRTFAAQGDLAAALLDVLQIERAASIGLSAGGPAALSMAAQHPDRTWALVLEGAVTDAYVPTDLARNHRLGRLILSPILGGPTFWWLHRRMVRKPCKAAEKLLEIESTLDPERRRRCAEFIAADPDRWTALADSLVPYRRRRTGLRNDLAQLERVDVREWARIRVPTLLQYSSTDADVPIHHAEALVALGVPAKLIVYQDACGHLLWFGPSAPQLSETRAAFLAGHGSRDGPVT